MDDIIQAEAKKANITARSSDDGEKRKSDSRRRHRSSSSSDNSDDEGGRQPKDRKKRSRSRDKRSRSRDRKKRDSSKDRKKHSSRSPSNSGRSKKRSGNLQDFDLGVRSTGNDKVDDAIRVLRLIHVARMRELQTQINNLLAGVQKITANPQANLKLGRVGR